LKAHKITLENSTLYLWDFDVPPPVSNHPQRLTLSHPKRQLEFDLISACLPAEIDWSHIEKTPTGKPILIHGPHLSISHSGAFGAVMISSKPVGLDIQIHRDMTYRIREKYCHKRELDWLGDEKDARYLKLWCAKEAIYKAYGHSVDFSHDLQAHCFDSEDAVIRMTYLGPAFTPTQHLVHFLPHPLLCIAYTEIP
jgi:4'-phosphopantetheinyl transferase EntD